jgi:hypothetical protein
VYPPYKVLWDRADALNPSEAAGGSIEDKVDFYAVIDGGNPIYGATEELFHRPKAFPCVTLDMHGGLDVAVHGDPVIVCVQQKYDVNKLHNVFPSRPVGLSVVCSF